MNSTAAHPASPPPALSQNDLAELLGAFNDATVRLQAAHERLQGEVERLQNELRQANEQLERSRRLAALGEMAAGIAHEIRNPLGSIRLYARMLEEDLRDREAERGIAVRIGSAVRTVDAVVQDVLAFAKEVRVRPVPVAPEDLFSRAIDEVMALGDAGIEVRRLDREPGASGLEEVECDPALMQRALTNILANAVQAMAEAGASGRVRRLTTAASRRAIVDAEGVKRWFGVLSVTDTGPGIPEGVIDRIFNPFFTTRATGTGLGLAIVHRIVDAHGGRVMVRNIVEDGQTLGAAVELLLPGVTAGEEKPADRSAPGRAKRWINTTARPLAASGRNGRARVTEGAE